MPCGCVVSTSAGLAITRYILENLLARDRADGTNLRVVHAELRGVVEHGVDVQC
jgi:hypothetical protein